MPTTKYLFVNTKPLPLNLMDLRDQVFYDFIRQFSGKKLQNYLHSRSAMMWIRFWALNM
jgi:hypothetical protein